MATVTTPTGETLQGVDGSLLDYYRGEAATVEGYVIVEDEAEQAAVFPMVMQPGADEPVSAAPADVEGDLSQLGAAADEAAQVSAEHADATATVDQSSGQHAAD